MLPGIAVHDAMATESRRRELLRDAQAARLARASVIAPPGGPSRARGVRTWSLRALAVLRAPVPRPIWRRSAMPAAGLTPGAGARTRRG